MRHIHRIPIKRGTMVDGGWNKNPPSAVNISIVAQIWSKILFLKDYQVHLILCNN